MKTLQKISLILAALLLISCFEEEDKLQQAIEQCTEVDMASRNRILMGYELNYPCYQVELDTSFPMDWSTMDSIGVGRNYAYEWKDFWFYRSPLDTDVVVQLRDPTSWSVMKKAVLFCAHRRECELMDCDSDLAQVWYDQSDCNWAAMLNWVGSSGYTLAQVTQKELNRLACLGILDMDSATQALVMNNLGWLATYYGGDSIESTLDSNVLEQGSLDGFFFADTGIPQLPDSLATRCPGE
ncbi:MAG TPA: hypothetical protein VLM37_08460 [Fibrobacteraceae bacterium]|nr:hypothetical protein [Fibrobacteraceae bacterium]